MSYADIDGVFSRYKPIATLVGSANVQVASVDVSTIFIADAEGFVDAFLSRRYETPLSPVPRIITQITSDLAIFNMMVEKLPEVPDFFQPRYDRAMSWLEMIRDGQMDLTSQTVVTTGDQDAWSSTEDYHPVFSPVLDPIDQTVDKDQVDAAKDLRSGDIGASGTE